MSVPFRYEPSNVFIFKSFFWYEDARYTLNREIQGQYSGVVWDESPWWWCYACNPRSD